MNYLLPAIAIIALGFFLGRLKDIDLEAENTKLRKENEILWKRIKDEGKVLKS